MDSSKSNQLFVYSSLRKGFQQATYDYITEFFSFVSTARVEGLLSDLDNIPVATNGVKGSFIIGELYQLKKNVNASYVFAQLDDYEGLVMEHGEEALYRRELTTVFSDDGSVSEAWVYWYNGDVKGKPTIISGDVFEFMESRRRAQKGLHS